MLLAQGAEMGADLGSMEQTLTHIVRQPRIGGEASQHILRYNEAITGFTGGTVRALVLGLKCDDYRSTLWHASRSFVSWFFFLFSNIAFFPGVRFFILSFFSTSTM